jgi:hypothetical protein
LGVFLKYCLFFIKILFIFCAFSTSAQKIRVGLVEYPPHLNFDAPIEESKLYQYFQRIVKQLGLDVEYVKYPDKRGGIELKKGAVDILLPYDESIPFIKTLDFPLFHATPGLCFRKQNFIPILSATHRFKDLVIAVPIGTTVVPALADSEALLVDLKGVDAIRRGIDLTQRGRLDAFYHPSPGKVYHQKNIMYQAVACSYFYGYFTGVYIATSPHISDELFTLLNNALKQELEKQSYEFYFTK